MKKVQMIQSACVIVVASLGLASMGCFSMMASGDTTGTRIAAAGADVVTAPLQIGVVVVISGVFLVVGVPMMMIEKIGDEPSEPTEPVVAEGPIVKE